MRKDQGILSEVEQLPLPDEGSSSRAPIPAQASGGDAVAGPFQDSPFHWLLLRAGLLAGLGSQAEPVAGELSAGRSNRDQSDERRTCVDAGWPLLFTVRSPGSRSLCVLLRESFSEGGTARWTRVHQQASKCERQLIETFPPGSREAWPRALDLASRLGAEDFFRRRHARLGLQGRLFSIACPMDDRGLGSSVTWHLDRSSSLVEALSACGAGNTWPAAAEVLQRLLGRLPSPKYGPWSITCDLCDPVRTRLGTTSWARGPEDDSKRRRFAATVQSLRGDGRFAEALYRLLESRPHSEPGSARTGRAVEIEIANEKVASVECYLAGSVPCN